MKPHLLLFIGMYVLEIALCCVYIKLDNGIIKGRLARTAHTKKTFYAFQEIPYAAPPLEDLRFQPPQPVQNWKGTLDTTRNTKTCFQIGPDSVQESEDCLYLNVYTPELPSKNKEVSLTVMVYFHGGGFILGDGTYKLYGPDFLVDQDVIIVTLNYRLGVFGFLSTQDEVLPGNNGLKDQLFALQWVKKNIYLFGGDSSKVTIFGQSAGAASVGYHLISKKSRGLYRAAIMESSCALNAFGYQRNARTFAFKIASAMNSSLTESSTSDDVLKIMLQAPARNIDAAAQIIVQGETYDNAQLFQGYYYAPVVELDSEEAFLTEKMFEIVKRGDADSVPVVVGINSEESLSQTTDINFVKGLMSRFDVDLKALVPNDMNVVSDSLETEAGEHIRQIYSKNDLLQSVPSAGVRYMSDISFTKAVIKYAELQSQFSDVYFYYFSYDGEIGNVSIIVDGTERVGHNEEIPYLWRVQSDMFDNYKLAIFPEKDIKTHNRLVTLWTTFAKTLNPTPESLDILENIIWSKVKPEEFSYLNINETLDIKSGYPKESFSEWTAIYDEFGVEPYDTY